MARLFCRIVSEEEDLTRESVRHGLASNESERDTMVSILGIAGVLSVPSRPTFARGYVAWSDRELPNRHFNDVPFPACRWRGSDGIDEAAIEETFGHLL